MAGNKLDLKHCRSHTRMAKVIKVFEFAKEKVNETLSFLGSI